MNVMCVRHAGGAWDVNKSWPAERRGLGGKMLKHCAFKAKTGM